MRPSPGKFISYSFPAVYENMDGLIKFIEQFQKGQTNMW